MRTEELVRYGVSLLAGAGIADGLSDVYMLLGHVLGKNRTGLMVAARDEVAERQQARFMALLDRRLRREPVAYILGEQEFWSLPFVVTPDVLIPRPETEFLIEKVLARSSSAQLDRGAIVDLCCGSGVIAVILARELGRKVVGIDISSGALLVSDQNRRRHGVEERVQLVRSDLLSALNPRMPLSLLVSNPPYVSSGAVRHELAPEVAGYEPHLALDGGECGLDVIARIRESLPDRLASGGMVFMEIGWDQGEAVYQMFSQQRTNERMFTTVEIIQDYAGRDRVLHAVIE